MHLGAFRTISLIAGTLLLGMAATACGTSVPGTNLPSRAVGTPSTVVVTTSPSPPTTSAPGVIDPAPVTTIVDPKTFPLVKLWKRLRLWLLTRDWCS